MAVALLTNYLTPYRMPLLARLAERHGTEVLCFGAGERYIPEWFADLDAQLERAPFPARRLHGPREALGLGRSYELVIAPFAGGAVLPAAYASARRYRRPFILWASVWVEPRSLTHTLTRPLTRLMYRDADAVLAYGEHVRRFVAANRRTADRVFVAPQSVEPELFARAVSPAEVEGFRTRHGLGPDGPIVLFVGRLVPEKGAALLAEAWPQVKTPATLVVVGDGPLAGGLSTGRDVRLLGALPRSELPVAYALAASAGATVVPSIPTARFREPWALVCNEAMHQGGLVIASDAVGAAAGGLVRDGQTGLVVPAGDPAALAAAVDRGLGDPALRGRLGQAGREAVSAYTYDAMVDAFDGALAAARRRG